MFPVLICWAYDYDEWIKKFFKPNCCRVVGVEILLYPENWRLLRYLIFVVCNPSSNGDTCGCLQSWAVMVISSRFTYPSSNSNVIVISYFILGNNGTRDILRYLTVSWAVMVIMILLSKNGSLVVTLYCIFNYNGNRDSLLHSDL